ncbi:type II toxin-antitoxin system PemK/MazF family toxin [Agromyces sp. Marseille-P2726]|uniref:type II toxin-antitoxin system PemK/MazF family toxin n=1 Tax=Agromyces sp. Marseille-P2726 TaxID=2709132 RepID=UPI001C2D1875|nr:type II toxin-antitoxin system PemK/MazF family toxin [Agromyces sp. Marseille-P2726]
MSDTSRFLTALGRVIRSLSGSRRSAARSQPGSDAASATSTGTSTGTGLLSPGQAGPDATIEVDPSRLQRVRLAYAPSRDGDPDPGEIVWTWVPYEERDGRGKDRPVAIVAASRDGDFLAVQLTSRPHDGDRDYVALGHGAWDASGRPSWARIDRVFRVRSGGMRREAASLDAARYARITGALRDRYGWR